MPAIVDPLETQRGARIHRTCLSLAAVSFCFWLFSSEAISTTIQSLTRIAVKLWAR
jgi:hypothetical protein